MRSFAIWYSAKDYKTEIEKKATVHVNIWDKPHENDEVYCFDFGVLVEDMQDIKSIFLYAPFEVQKNQIKDLGMVISNNRLVNAIFNENFTTTDGEPKRLIVNATNGKSAFVIYSLEVENQIDLVSFKRNGTTPGTIIEIKVDSIDLNSVSRYYFRIRIEASKKGIVFINDEIKGVSILNNQFTNTEVIDFRLNDVRSYSEELKEQFNKGIKFQLLAVHYLILRNANDTIIHYGKDINSRILENNLWKSYIDEADYTIIAYHIKSKAENVYNSSKNEYEKKYIEDFSDLTRFQSQKDTKMLIFKYVIVIVILGALGGVLGNLISKAIGL
ncbi:hypothetical protein [Paenibacillus sp. P36]|uniref:hypothetical protein n=1 Tax=Paenibacillus sp. P36 TaxID=3342538 RepID=UPI0038B264B3